MEPAASEQLDLCPSCLAAGLDSLYVGYNLDLATSNIDFVELEYRKGLVRDGERGKALITIGSEQFSLGASGAYPYRYVLRNDAMTLCLAERMQPSVKVQFSSKALWHDKFWPLHQRVLHWATTIGATVVKPETVIRADWAFDFNLAEVDFAQDQFLSRARKESTHGEGGQVQTFQYGKGEIVVRVYDKVAEIEQQSGKAWFFDIWGQSQNVWRIEFQLRGQRLKQSGIRTVADLRDLHGDLLRDLTERHTTLRQLGTDSNKSRWPLHPLWESLQAEVSLIAQHGLIRAFDEPSYIDYRLSRLAQSVYGSLKGLAALYHLSGAQHSSPPDLRTILDEFPDLVSQLHSERLWDDDIQQRLNDHEMGRW